MKMEFIDATGNGKYEDAAPDFLVRLSDFNSDDQKYLIEAIKHYLFNLKQPLELHKLSFIEPVNCLVTFVIKEEDTGIIADSDQKNFQCLLTLSAYETMIEIVERVGDGYNWLTPGEYLDSPAFLISRFGSW